MLTRAGGIESRVSRELEPSWCPFWLIWWKNRLGNSWFLPGGSINQGYPSIFPKMTSMPMLEPSARRLFYEDFAEIAKGEKAPRFNEELSAVAHLRSDIRWIPEFVGNF